MGKRVKRTDTIFFVEYDNIPYKHRKDIIYVRIVVEYWPQNDEPNRTQLTVEVNLIEYHGDVSTSTNDTTTYKIVWYSVVPTPKSKFVWMIILKITSVQHWPEISISGYPWT